MDVKQLRLIALASVALVAAFLLGRRYLPVEQDSPDVNYFTGMLVFGKVSHCGLVKILAMDRKSCVLPESFCADHNELLNKRIRLTAKPTGCRDGVEMRCSEGGDFYEAGFAPNECFESPRLQKVFEGP